MMLEREFLTLFWGDGKFSKDVKDTGLSKQPDKWPPREQDELDTMIFSFYKKMEIY